MAISADRIAALTVKFFERAGQDQELSERMSFADTVIHIHFTGDAGDPGASCTLYLDRSPIGAELGTVGDAEVQITGSAETWIKLISGNDRIPMAILHGELTYRGPVRKFLRVTPILSNFDYSGFQQVVRAEDATTPDAGTAT